MSRSIAPRSLPNTALTQLCSGNNINAINVPRGVNAIGDSQGRFQFVQDPTLSPTVDVNANASVVNAFYVTNLMHDISYRYGFNELSGNFQADNLGRGGVANDAVNVRVQDPSEPDNAHFNTKTECAFGRLSFYGD